MKDLFVNYNQALELKELGFDEPCLAVFNDSKQFRINSESKNWNDNVKNGDTTSAPLFSQCFRFFREKYKITSSVRDYFAEEFFYEIHVSFNHEITSNMYTSYEEAESACLDKLIEIAKTK